MKRIILASMSPRRRELMRLLPIEFEVCAVDIDESIDKNKSPSENAMEIAKRKAQTAGKLYDD
ncbi:MAG: Maf-like protein, partial [Clostridiales bacterium]|nr:Maf-like protein [Clostridiales bacterium]